MLDNIALNVVIGLVFIYLLYSLLATVIAEIVATQLRNKSSKPKGGHRSNAKR